MTSWIWAKTSKCHISSLELRWKVYDPSSERKFHREYDGWGNGSRGLILILVKILGHLGPMTSSNGKIAMSRVLSWAERSLTPHWIRNFIEIAIGGVMTLIIDVVNFLNTLWAYSFGRNDVIKIGKMQYLEFGKDSISSWSLIRSGIISKIYWDNDKVNSVKWIVYYPFDDVIFCPNDVKKHWNCDILCLHRVLYVFSGFSC